MTPDQITTMQEIYFDLTDLIDQIENGEAKNIKLKEFAEFDNLLEFLQEQRDKLADFTLTEEV
jgi:hypothetical protein